MTNSLKNRLEEIIENALKYDETEDSYDGYEAGSPEEIDNRLDWTERVKNNYFNQIISLLEESIDEWMPKKQSSSQSTANETFNEALSQTEENFRKWLHSGEDK